eukprot:TRINITY_DN2570_c0_g1_i1.p1 TRINITY_DN2570_c0_g1~~TRINITY_DN2570_c0_g1_i1.p1  ORF type:complete len:283 (-),score=30.88 TRINITY_DN2570_c0_g1_i1:74-922(-)
MQTITIIQVLFFLKGLACYYFFVSLDPTYYEVSFCCWFGLVFFFFNGWCIANKTTHYAVVSLLLFETIVRFNPRFLWATTESMGIQKETILVIGGLVLTHQILSYSHKLASSVWIFKSVFFDWMVGAVLMLLLALYDLFYQTAYFTILLAYLIGSNALGVGLMKCFELMMNWNSPEPYISAPPNNVPPSPNRPLTYVVENQTIEYVNSIKTHITVLPTLRLRTLLLCFWIMIYLFIFKTVQNYELVKSWQFSVWVGFVSTLLVYLYPMIAHPIPQIVHPHSN